MFGTSGVILPLAQSNFSSSNIMSTINATLTDQDFQSAANILNCEVAAIKSVADVETAGAPFFPNGWPKLLFEALTFHRYTGGKYDATAPNISSPTWNRALYGKTWDAEFQRFQTACTLDRRAAVMSCSWGMFQIMGFNFALCGYTDVDAFVNDMKTDVAHHLSTFVQYVKHMRLDVCLQNHDWVAFAQRYNGPSEAENHYHDKLAAAYAKFKTT